MNEKELKVLEYVKLKGPCFPTDISKELGIESYISGAILSTLLHSGKIKMSHRKIGSSSLYYVEGQEEKVRGILKKTLKELEIKVLNRMKELKVAFQEDLYPQERFLLNELKDFVTPLKIKTDENKEILCWKLYSITNEEFNNLIKQKLGSPKQQELTRPQEENKNKIEEEKEKKVEKDIEEKPKKTRKRERKSNIEWDNIINGLAEKYHFSINGYLEQKTNECKLLGKMYSNFGEHDVLIAVFNKKVNRGDLSRIYVEAINKKMPAIVIAKDSGKMTIEYAKKNFGQLLKVILEN